MKIDSCYKLGHITKAHGLKGDVSVHLEIDSIERFIDKESVFVEINKKLVPFFIENISIPKPNTAVFKFEDVDTFEAVKPLLNAALYLPQEKLPELGKDEFYYADVIGYTINDQNLGKLGVVEEFYEMPGQDLLCMIYKEKEVLIPVNKEILLRTDHQVKEVYTNLPDGLIELYMEEPKDEN